MSLFGGGAGGANKPGLSINTGTANLFGSNAPSSTPAAAGGLFGASSSATTKPAATSLFGTAGTGSSSSTAGTLFGAGTANAATSAPSLFGGTATAGAPSAAGALFGGAAAASAAKPAAGGLFGAGTATTAAPAGGGLFGASMNNTAAPATAGSLFAANTGAATTTGSSLFGAKPATGGGLFGGSTNAAPATNAGGLFGASTTGNTGGGLFGASTQPNAGASSLFGGANNAAAASASAGAAPGQPSRPGVNQPVQPAPQQTQRSIFNSSIGSFTASQATVPGVRVDASNLRPTTRFADLHEVMQQELERLDGLILRQQAYADECQQAMPPVQDALAYVPSDADFCAQKLDALQSALEADAAAIDALKRATRHCANDAKASFRNISALRAPSSYGGGNGSSTVVGPNGVVAASGVAAPVPAGLLDDDDAGEGAEGSGAGGSGTGGVGGSGGGGRDLAGYMTRQVAEMEKKLARFRGGLGEVESYLASIEAGTVARVQSAQLRSAEGGRRRSAGEQVRELAAVLRDMEGGILAVAGKVGAVREAAQQTMIEESRLRGRLGPLY